MLFDNNGQYGFWIEPGGVLRCVAGASLGAGAVAAGTWTHVACASDATAITIYVNGEAAGTGAGTAPGTGGVDGSSIAANVPSGDSFLGRLDGLRVWDHARVPTP